MALLPVQGKFEALTKELITHILEFKEGEENFVRSEQFVLSNLLYHHCLAVNSHAVRRSIDGLALKFIIHGQQIRAQKLNELTERFLVAPVFKDHYEIDIEWSLLSFLLHLSNSPTQVTLIPAEQRSFLSEDSSSFVLQNVAEKHVDWPAYLLKGESEYVAGAEDPLSDWSDNEDDADVVEDNRNRLDGHRTSDLSLSEHCQEIPVVLKIVKHDVKIVEQHHRAKSWIFGNGHIQYWKGKTYQHEGLSSHLAANVSKICEVARRDEGDGGKRCHRISEFGVMREVLWLLMYPVSSYIFRKNEEGDFELKSSISLPSLSMGSTFSILQELCTPLKQLAKLDSFIRLYECPEMEPPTPVTLLAYAAGLRLWRRTFQKNICILEGIVKKQEKFCTLSWLQSELNSWFRVLSTIYSVHYAAFCVGEDNSPRNLALRLIGSLCEGVEGCGDKETRSVMLRLLLHTLRNYCTIMHNWLLSGSLVDHADEFIIQRHASIQVTDEIYWQKAFTLNYSLGCQEIADSDPLKIGVKLFLPLALAMFSVGKAQELLSALQINYSHDDTKSVTSLSCTFGEEKTLEEILINHVVSVIEGDLPKKMSDQEDEHKHTACDSPMPNSDEKTRPYKGDDAKVDKLVNISDVDQDKDTAIIQNILSLSDSLLLNDQCDNEDISKNVNNTSDEQMDIVARRIEDISVVPRGISVLSLLGSSLRPLITRKQNELDMKLNEVLIKDYQLDRHCRAVRSVLLMEAGDVMHEFYTYLFTKLDCGEAVDNNSLSLHLQYCIARLYPDLARLFSVSVEQRFEYDGVFQEVGDRKEKSECQADGKSRADSTAEQLLALGVPYITVHYQAPWPITMLLTEEIMKKFNLLFRFSLSLKRATNGLERLKFKDMASLRTLVFHQIPEAEEREEDLKSPLQTRLHHLQLFRLWLLSFARELHNYFANVVFMPYYQAFEELVNSKTSLNTVISNHEKLLNRVLSLCFMGHDTKVSPLQVVLNKVFMLTHQLSRMWMKDIGRVTSEELTSLESEYAQVHRYLVTLLAHLTSTKFLPHLEGLTRTLSNTMPLLTHQT